MNWGAWLSGGFAALATGLLTAIGALAVFKECPSGWQFFVVAGIPTVTSFLMYVKQTPPPIGKGGTT